MRRQAAGLAVLAAMATAPAAPAAVDVPQSGWSWGSPRPQGNDLLALELAGSGRGYAAGAYGTLLRTEDGGASWTGIRTGRQTTFRHLDLIAADAFVAGGGCTLRRSDDGGRTLRRLVFASSETDCPTPLAALSFTSPQAGVLALADGTVLRTDDGGQTFARRASLPAPVHDVELATSDVGLASTGGGEVSRTTDGGATWTPAFVSPAAVHDLHWAPGAAYAAGSGPFLHRSTDGGRTWERRALQGAAGDAIVAIRCRDADTCLMITARGGRLLRTDDGGETVTAVPAPDDGLRAVAWAGADRAVAVGRRGATLASSDSGMSFGRIGGELPGRYTGIRAAGGDLAFAVGRHGALARTTDGGVTWTAGGVSTSQDVVDASFATATMGYALDAGGTVLRTDNGGASWRILATGTGSAARAILALDARTLVIAGRGLRRSGDGGGTFDPVGPRRAAVERLDRAGPAIVAYGRRTLLMSGDRGRRWRRVKRPSRRRAIATVDFVSRRAGYLLDDTGRVFATRNGGRRWRELLGIGASDVDGMAFSDSRHGWLVLDAYRGDRAGWLLRTDDGGRTFRPQLVSESTLIGRALGTPTLIANGTRKGIAISLGVETAEDDYSGETYTISGPQSFFATAKAGDAGRRSRLTLRGPARPVRRGTRVRIKGRLSPARGGETVLVSIRRGGSPRWRSVSVRADSSGRFALSRRADRRLRVVAQWQGDDARAPAGSRVLRVRVR